MTHETELLIFETGGVRCALPLKNVIRVESAAAITPLPGAPKAVAGIIDVHGSILPVMNMRTLLNLPAQEMTLKDHLVLARTSRRETALWVDSVQGVELCSEAPQGHVSTVLKNLPHLAGVTALADGMILICDLEKFLSADEEHQLTKALEAAAG